MHYRGKGANAWNCKKALLNSKDLWKAGARLLLEAEVADGMKMQWSVGIGSGCK